MERNASQNYQLTGTRPLPLTYYHPTGPLAQGLRLARAASGAPSQPLRVGIVGLGAGAMACHAISGERWRFFEIDPEVVRIATNPALFSYLGICQPDAEFIVGDARLTLAGQPEASFDYLLVDAFSSDAIPVHLLTVEALRLYARHLSDRGVLAITCPIRTSICRRSWRAILRAYPSCEVCTPKAKAGKAPSARKSS